MRYCPRTNLNLWIKRVCIRRNPLHEKDILNYPNICLRLARYGAGRLTVGQRAFFAAEAVHWFEERIQMGDAYSDESLAQAKRLYEELTPAVL